MYRDMQSSNLYFALSLLTMQHYLQPVGIISLISSRQLIWLQTELMDFFFLQTKLLCILFMRIKPHVFHPIHI